MRFLLIVMVSVVLSSVVVVIGILCCYSSVLSFSMLKLVWDVFCGGRGLVWFIG